MGFFMERIDDLGLKNLKLIQNTDYFCFGTDAVLLSDFATVKPGFDVVDLCSGNGIIPVLLCGKTKAKKITGIEIQKENCDLARRSIKLNGLEDKVDFICDDANNIENHFKRESISLVTCNPPYMSGNWGFISPNDLKAAARHELYINIDDVAKISAYLLKHGGYMAMIHKSDRLCDIVCAMRKYKIEPKRIRFVHSFVGDAPKLVLIEGIKGAKPSLKIMEPLYIYNDDKTYTDEVKKLYNNREI